MEISIKDIFKALLKKWYIVLAILCICLAIGTGIAFHNYNTVKYTASSTFIFNNPPSSAYVNECKTYLTSSYIEDSITIITDIDYSNSVYKVTLDSSSSTLTINVTSENEELALKVLNLYTQALYDDNNPIMEYSNIHNLVPPYSREEQGCTLSVLTQIGLFAFIGLLISGAIILYPLYNEEAKEERINKIIEEHKEKLEQEKLEQEKQDSNILL